MRGRALNNLKEFSPNIWTDEREIHPRQIELSGQHLLQRTHGAFPRRWCTLDVHHDWFFLPWQRAVTFTRNRFLNQRENSLTNGLAAKIIAQQCDRKFSQQV